MITKLASMFLTLLMMFAIAIMGQSCVDSANKLKYDPVTRSEKLNDPAFIKAVSENLEELRKEYPE